MHVSTENAAEPYSESPEAEFGDEIDLAAAWNKLSRGKWWIAGITALIVGVTTSYAFLATPWYRAEVLLAPAASKQTEGLAGQLSSLSGLASLAGINVGGGGTPEPLAVLKSRDFARTFIERENLLPVFFAKDWDSASSRWKPADPMKWPDSRDGIKYFSENVRVVQEDKKTGLVTLAIEWKNPRVAAAWANSLVDLLNSTLRSRALVDAQTNVDFLQHELSATGVVTLQQSIGRLLDTELQKLMLARGKKEFAFRVIDRAEVPKWRAHPERAKLIGFSFFLGLAISVVLVLAFGVGQRRPNRQL